MSDPLNYYSEPEVSQINLHKGYNQVSFPAEVLYYVNVENLLAEMGGSAIISDVYLFDPVSKTFDHAGYDKDGFFFGVNMDLLPGRGLDGMIVYAKQDYSKTFTSRYCRPWEAQPGMNLTGSGCVDPGTTAFDVLQAIGQDTVPGSIQRFNTASGLFETAHDLGNGQQMGPDYPVIPGEGYFIATGPIPYSCDVPTSAGCECQDNSDCGPDYYCSKPKGVCGGAGYL